MYNYKISLWIKHTIISWITTKPGIYYNFSLAYIESIEQTKMSILNFSWQKRGFELLIDYFIINNIVVNNDWKYCFNFVYK